MPPKHKHLPEKWLLESIERWSTELKQETTRNKRLRRALHEGRARREVAQRKLARRRRQLERERRVHTNKAQKCLDAAEDLVGTTESPAGSNSGPFPIDECQQRFGFNKVAWCGCFLGWLLEVYGKVDVTPRIAGTWLIAEDAQAGANGMRKAVPVRQSEPGDLWVFHFGSGGPKHVGMFDSWANAAKTEAWCYEGNTSFDNNGSQANGGAIAKRKRSSALVHTVARPAWPA